MIAWTAENWVGIAACVGFLVGGTIAGIVWIGGALAEVRERRGWTPAEPSVYDVDDVRVVPVICSDCGDKLTDALVVRDGAGRQCLNGCREAAEVLRWHRQLDCRAVAS